MKKKLLSALLALSMVASLLPMTSLAATDEGLKETVTIHGKSFETEKSFTKVDKATTESAWTDSVSSPNSLEFRGEENKAGQGTTSIELESSGNAIKIAIVDQTALQAMDDVANSGGSSNGETYWGQLKSAGSSTFTEIKNVDELEGTTLENDKYLCIMTSFDEDYTLYIGKIVVKSAQPDVALKANDKNNTYNQIKGIPVSGTKLTGEGNADLSQPSNYTSVTLDQAAASDKSKKTVFTANDEPYAKTVVKMVPALEEKANQNVAGLFASASELGETDDVVFTDNKAWIVVEVTAENGSKGYYVYLVKLASNAGAGIADPKAVIDSKATDFVSNGNLSGGNSLSSPELLDIKVPNGTTLSSIPVTFDVAEGATVRWAVAGVNSGVNSWNQEVLTGKTKMDISSVAFKSGSTVQALYVEVTAPDAKEKKYYKFTITEEAANSNAEIISGKVKADPSDESTTVEIVKTSEGEGSYKKPYVLQAELPYVDASKGYTSPEIDLVIEKNATINVVADAIEKEMLDNAFDDRYDGEETPKDNGDGTKTVVVKKEGAKAGATTLSFGKSGSKQHVYILVTAQDKETKKVYRLDITIGKAGTEARVKALTLKRYGNVVTGVETLGLSEVPSTDKEFPTTLTLTVPKGTNDDGLSLEVTPSLGAKVTFYDKTFGTDDKTNTNGIYKSVTVPGEYYFIVESQKLNAEQKPVSVGYYKLEIKWADLSDKSASDNVEVNVAEKKVTATGCVEATAQDIIDGINYSGSMTVYKNDGTAVAAGEKVGTGYYVMAGDTKIDIVVMGDTNGDAEIDIADAVKVRNHILESELTSLQAEAADVNEDGTIDIADAVAIRNSLL